MWIREKRRGYNRNMKTEMTRSIFPLCKAMLLVILAFHPLEIHAQVVVTPVAPIDNPRTCATWEVHQRLWDIDTLYRKNQIEIENFTKSYEKYIRGLGAAGLRSGVVIIPVVVHVVYHTAAQNISDAQIQSQIDILNEDFRRLNADVSSVPSVFQPVVADARIQFQFAVRDPNCNSTNGITRTATAVTSFTHDDAVKYTASGGIDAWLSDKYLNIWLCNLGGGLLGYAQFPGGPAATDGVVIDYEAFGNTGTAASPFDLGRTATHEIGHWLNLRHIWGDDCPSSNQCAGSDGVADTPNQECMNYGCPSFPHVSCSNGPDGDMFMNYMDYVDDDCMITFTAGQSTRMDATLYGARSAILGSDGLIPPPALAAADLWSQDQTDDVGDEPNTISPHIWRSDDIWVRKQNDGFVNQEHVNPEYRAPGFGSNYVYVRIRNKSCSSAGSATAKLYWAKASTGLSWPAPWDGSVTSPALMGSLIGTQSTGSVAAGSFVILEFPWYPPNPADYVSFGADKSHFCLLSRIETASTPPFGMTFPEGSNLGTNVRNNNNIVWKNITVVDDFTGSGKMAWVTVGDMTKKASLVKFVFETPKKNGQKSIFEWGTVTVDLGERLFEKWREGNSTGKGIKVVDAKLINVIKPDAWIGNIKLDPDEMHTVKVQFEPFKLPAEENNIFNFHLTQYAAEQDIYKMVAGQSFILKSMYSKPGPPFYPFSVSIHSGTAIPTGSFADDFEFSYNGIVDIDYHFTPRLALVGLLGYNDFRSKIEDVDDTYWINLSLNLRYYWPIQLAPGPSFSFYIGAGPGIYIPEDGDTEFGANAGLGINYELSPPITFELGTDYHWIFDPEIQFIHSHTGLVFRF